MAEHIIEITSKQRAEFKKEEPVCKNCKWFGKDIYIEAVCKNESVRKYTPREYPYNLHLAPPESFGCNQWKNKV